MDRGPKVAPESRAVVSLLDEHLAEVERFYDAAPADSNWAGRRYRKLLANYYRHLIPPQASVLEVGCGSGELVALLPNRDITGVDLSSRQIERARQRIPHGRFYVQAGERLDLDRLFDYIILSETVNLAGDVQALFERLGTVSHSGTRLVLNFHSNLWRPALTMARAFGLKAKHPILNWFTTEDVRNLLWLTDWEVLKHEPRILMPAPLAGFDRLLNRWIAPFAPWFCLCNFVVARPKQVVPRRDFSTTVVIPARNEAGNVEPAVQRLPPLGTATEIIFIEGHSKDNTWEEIQRVARAYPELTIKCLKQTGRGKGNAVREAFAEASGDILMILDADLTMPPEELPKFYEVLSQGRAEFANGVRLVYPMDERAMQFFNLCANKAFGMIFSWLLGQPIKDTLCGTKVLFRRDYERIAANRSYFGDFDPFGDFDLLFGAGRLHLKMVDIPIRYRERTYGETNIQRWRHGLLLARMVLFAAGKLKFL
jgi:SAM-dependent methyltransferase